jgi:hypothetical protein
MNLHTRESSLLDDSGSLAIALDQFVHLGIGELARRREKRLHVRTKRNGRRCYGFPVQSPGSLPARMVELHPALGALPGACLSPGLQCCEVTIVLNHHIAGFSARTAINHDVAGDAQADTAIRPSLVQADQFGRGRTIAVAQCL